MTDSAETRITRALGVMRPDYDKCAELGLRPRWHADYLGFWFDCPTCVEPHRAGLRYSTVVVTKAAERAAYLADQIRRRREAEGE